MDQALASFLTALADDELITGHRISEWCGHAPILEEDIAFANIALDEIGHARLWLQLAAQTLDEDPQIFPDQQCFFRAPDEFRNLQITELPNGDWAFCMLRQYFFDSFEIHRLAALKDSREKSMAEIANKISVEEIYHLRHTQAWMRRLALGTQESARRCQQALDELWPHTAQFAAPLPGEPQLLAQSAITATEDIYSGWLAEVQQFLTDWQLQIPQLKSEPPIAREIHTPHLAELLQEMQQVARWEPEGRW